MTGPQADVRSIDAVRDWHAALANYADSLAEALAGVELELRRGDEWLDEQQALWKQAVRDCEEEVVRAKAELSQRKFKTWDGRDPDCTVQERALRRAKARLEHAEEQVEKVRQWKGRLPEDHRRDVSRRGPAAATLPRRRSAQGAGGPGAANRLARGVRSAPARLRVGLWAKP